MNRYMIDVFPTFIEPRNTTLYFISHKLVLSQERIRNLILLLLTNNQYESLLYSMTTKFQNQIFINIQRLRMNQEQEHKQQSDYLRASDLIPNSSSEIPSLLFKLLKQRDKTIESLSQQITKYKCESITQTKTITTLQQKVNQLQPNNNNSASNFMMASEFKDLFDNFMKNQVSITFSGILHLPKVYGQVLKITFLGYYQHIGKVINSCIQTICRQLKVQGIQQKIFLSFLRILQDQNQQLLPFSFLPLSYDPYQQEELTQIVEGQQYLEMCNQLHKICVYMQLQEKKWEFIIPEFKIQPYTKKDHVCVDGWIKERQNILIILQGIIRDGHQHPNLKNYAIPYPQNVQPRLSEPPLILEKTTKIETNNQVQNEVSRKNQHQQQILKILANQIDEQIKESQENKENINGNIRILQNKQQKNQRNQKNQANTFHKLLMGQKKYRNLYKDRSFNDNEQKSKQIERLVEKQIQNHQKTQSNISQANILQKNGNYLKVSHVHQSTGNRNQYNPSLKVMKKIYEQDIALKIEPNLQKGKLRINSSVQKTKQSIKLHIQHQNIKNKGRNIISDPTFEEALVFPNSRNQEQDRLKKARKTSVGKIVNQIEHSQRKELDKQVRVKQKLYKQIIKDKLMEPSLKIKTDRITKKQENRPLRMSNNILKLREKYLG